MSSFVNNIIILVRLCAGIIMMLLGLVVGLIYLIGIIDPVGAKLSDDADPFGDPTISITQHLIMILITLSLFISAYFCLKLDKNN